MTMTDSPYEVLRRRHTSDLKSRLPEFLARNSWPAERIHGERRKRLRYLLAHAKQNSRWHAQRLAHIDPDTFEEADLVRLPTMTKADLMANFDEVITDRRISLAMLDEHLSRLDEGTAFNSYLLDRFHIVATSGSSGRRGVFIYDWDGWIVAASSSARIRAVVGAEVPSEADGVRPAMVAADKPSHYSYAINRTFFPETTLVPVTLPFAEIVTRLNSLQPNRISGYPSMLFQLCFAAAAGQLHIAPSTVICGAEPLLPEIRTALERTFSAKVFDAWGCSETAILGYSCPKGFGLHLLDDLTIMEPVNAQGALVGVGVPSAKILVTNLFNTLLPLIRYEISDSVTILDTPFPCACGSHFRTIAPVQGRSEETFTYEGGVFVHPFTFDSILSQHPAIIEYQVRQIPNGARIVVRAVSEFDHCALEARIAVALATLGLTKAKVTIELVPEIARGTTGKLNRFVPVRQRTSEQEGKR